MAGRVTQIKYLLLKKREIEKEIYLFGNSKITSNTGVRDNHNIQQTIRSKTYNF
jgi:hypothetical protein